MPTPESILEQARATIFSTAGLPTELPASSTPQKAERRPTPEMNNDSPSPNRNTVPDTKPIKPLVIDFEVGVGFVPNPAKLEHARKAEASQNDQEAKQTYWSKRSVAERIRQEQVRLNALSQERDLNDSDKKKLAALRQEEAEAPDNFAMYANSLEASSKDASEISLSILRDYEVAHAKATDDLEAAMIALYRRFGCDASPGDVRDVRILKHYRFLLDELRGKKTISGNTRPSAAIGRYVKGI